MHARGKILTLVVGAATVGVAAQAFSQTAFKNARQRSDIADKIVNTTTNIRSGDRVLVTGGVRDLELLEEICVDVRALGAFPFLGVQTERLTRMMFTDVPAQFDTQEPMFFSMLADSIDAHISVDFGEKLDLLADIEPKRLAAHAEAFQPIYKKMIGRGVLQVHLGNGLYPTQQRAKQFGVTTDKLAQVFRSGLNTNYTKMQQLGMDIKAKLDSGQTLRIKADNGTDLTCRVSDRSVFTSDGVITQEDRYSRGPNCQVWLPAGEVYLTPVPGTANGTFVAPVAFFEGKLIEDLTLTFRDGKLITFDGTGNIQALRKHYNAAPLGRELFSAIDIGINPDVKAPKNSKFVSWMGAGMISIGFGNNVWAGGDNDVPFDFFAHLSDGTLTIDNQTIVDRGTLRDR